MKFSARRVVSLLAVAAPALVTSAAHAQDAGPGEVAEAAADEEARWAAEREPSQLEPEKPVPSTDPPNIPADIMLGLRSGFGLAGGKTAEGGSNLSEIVVGQLPIQLDFGALFENGFYIGVYGQYGFGFLGSALADACGGAERDFPGTDVNCSAFDIRAGVAFEYHLTARKKSKATHGLRPEKTRSSVDPWLGLATGFEYVAWKVAARDAASAATATQSASGFEFLSGHFGVDFALTEWFAMGPFMTATMGSYQTASTSCEGDCEGFISGSGPIQKTSLHMWAFLGLQARVQIEGP